MNICILKNANYESHNKGVKHFEDLKQPQNS